MSAEGIERIFLYGTLRRGASRDILTHYHGVEFVAEGRVHGRLYDFGTYPGLQLDTNGGLVIGEIFDVTMPTLLALDEWEGIDETGTGEYRRIHAMVEHLDGTRESCWIYEVLPKARAGLRVIESGDWLDGGS